MKTNFKFALSTLFLTIAAIILLSGFTNQTSVAPNKVVLKGTFGNGILRSSTEDFIVTVNENSIYIDYWKDYSNITIEITNAFGQTVYEEVVNPITGEYLTIDISGWEKGNYQISFSNTSGESIYGGFDIE